MSAAELKRCFECGATYPQEVLACANDGTPLCFDTVGRRWKIEGVIGRRAGGAIFAAFHLVSGQHAAIDMLPGANSREATASTRFNQQLQALRILDQNKSILRLIEEGTERDGSRFMVTELGELRPLHDLIEEWRRPAAALMEPAEAALLVRPLLSLLSTAARLGMAHGSLDASQIFVGSASDFSSGLNNLAAVKLHGLAALGMGPQLREAQAADLRGIGRVLYELCTGKAPPSAEVLAREPLPPGLEGPLGEVVQRALGMPGTLAFATAEELQRALSTAALGGRPSQSSVPNPLLESMRSDPGLQAPRPPSLPSAISAPVVVAEPAAPAAPAVPKFLSLPPVPSGPPPPKQGSGPSSLPPVRVTAQHSAVPAPLASLISGPQRSGLTSELRQVSILDLMREMNEQKEKQETPTREETLARSRFRPSLNNIKPMARPDPSGRDPGPPGGVVIRVGDPSAPGALLGRVDSGATSLEPTMVDPNHSSSGVAPTPVEPSRAATGGTAPNRIVAASGGTAPNPVVAPGRGTAPNRTISQSEGTAPGRTISHSGGTAPNRTISQSEGTVPSRPGGTAPNRTISQSEGTVPSRPGGTAPNRTISQSEGTAPGRTISHSGGTAPNRTISQSEGTAPGRTVSQSMPPVSLPTSPAAERADAGSAPAGASGEQAAAAPSPGNTESPPPSTLSRPRNSAAQAAVTATTPLINEGSPPRDSPVVDSASPPAATAEASALGPKTEPASEPSALATPRSTPVARAVPVWTWIAVIGSLLAVIAVLVFKLLTKK